MRTFANEWKNNERLKINLEKGAESLEEEKRHEKELKKGNAGLERLNNQECDRIDKLIDEIHGTEGKIGKIGLIDRRM